MDIIAPTMSRAMGVRPLLTWRQRDYAKTYYGIYDTLYDLKNVCFRSLKGISTRYLQ